MINEYGKIKQKWGYKMKKIIAAIMTLFMLLGTVGCSTEGLNLYEEMKKTSSWECAETKGNVLVSMDVQGEKFELGADFSGYANTKETQAYIEMNINKIKLSDSAIDIKMSPVKMYVDKQAIYISKTYFTELMQLSGESVPEALKAIDAEYIGIDLSAGTQVTMLDQQKAMQLIETLFKGFEVKVPITQSGRTYTIELDADQMVDLSVQFIKEVINNIDEINKFSDTGMTQKDIDENKEEIELALTQGETMVKPMLKGSRAMLKYSFEDNLYKENMDVAIKFAFGEEKIDLNMVVNADSKKITKKDFKLPTSKVIYTMEELMGVLVTMETGNALTSDARIAQVSLDEVITKNKEKYIPLRDTMNQLDLKVNYDAKTKKSTIIGNHEEVSINTITEKGISYIALSEFGKLSQIDQFDIIDDEYGITIIR